MIDDDRNEKMAVARRKLQQFQKKKHNVSNTLSNTEELHANSIASSIPLAPINSSTVALSDLDALTTESVSLNTVHPVAETQIHPLPEVNGSTTTHSPVARLSLENTDLHSTIDRLSEALQQLSNENADLHLDISRMTLELNESYHNQKSSPKDMDFVRAQLEEAHTEIRLLVDQSRQSSAEHDARLAEISLLKGTIERLEKSMSNMEKWSAERELQLRELTTVNPGMSSEQAQRLESMVFEKDELIVQLRFQLEQEQSAKRQLQDDFVESTLKLETQSAELLKAQDLIVSQTKKMEACEAENIQLKNNLHIESQKSIQEKAALEALLTEKSNHLETIMHKQQEYVFDEGHISKLDAQIKTMGTRMQSLQEDNAALIRQLDELRHRNISLTNEKLQFVESLDVLQTKVSKLEAQSVTTPIPTLQSATPLDLDIKDETALDNISPHSALLVTTTPCTESNPSPSTVSNIQQTGVSAKSNIQVATTPRNDLVIDLQNKLTQLELQYQRVVDELGKEQKLTTLLTAEVEALPDFIQIYHQERKQLIEQMQKIAARLKNEGGVGSALSIGMESNAGSQAHLTTNNESFNDASLLANAYVGVSHGAVSGMLLQTQVQSIPGGCYRCKGWPLITL
ncbi:hypothetical protein O5D80_005474 [Batrachochytrium dendrobatidis]|nr:hypothetical protein O5D80_005474 [Batrachochytrium dendrobatidis]